MQSNNPLQYSELTSFMVESTHILGFVLSIGTIALLDFRLLGLWMRREPPSLLFRETAPWTLAGLVIMVFSGLLLYSQNITHYNASGPFRFKMVGLAVAIAFNYTIHWRVARSAVSPAMLRVVGSVSLLLWMSVVAGGLFIAFA
jgi:hypothetical protein